MAQHESADPMRTALEQTVEVLVRSLRGMGAAGRPDAASRLAARAYWAVKPVSPESARHIDGVMHYLAGLPAETTLQEDTTMADDRQIDVRTEPPARRHDLILGTYGQLSAGEGFVLVNDHDPKPLYYQFEAEHTGQFTWDYLETGPEVWRVRIGRPAAV